jgi:hypothetical protein
MELPMDKEVKETEKPAKRQRRPVGALNRLDVLKQDPNRVYRLINDDPARLAQFDAAGYRVESVEEHMPGAKKGTKGSSIENVFHAGAGQKQVLVSIEKELYDEDQALKQAKIDAVEAQMKNKTADGLQGFYGDIKITR